ncbi:MAG: porin family protein [Balneolaceae bacterium]
MKKLSALLLSCFLITGITTFAQAQSPLGIGVKGGVNIADFTGADFDTDTRTGGMLGISVDLTAPAFPVGFETGLYYTQKGTEVNGSSIDLDYLELPVLAKIHFGLPGPVNPHIIAGPYAGFNVNAESETTVSGTEDISDFVRSTDFGLLFGIGSDFNIGVATLNLQARYGMGLTNAFEDELENGEKNSVFSITLGYNF